MSLRTAVTCLATLVVVADCRSIGTSDNVTTRDDPFPDWVIFKNKHGEELGEFLQVETVTKKPKKRLALPMNFMMKAVAEPQPEDYFDRGLGEGEGEDYFEKRDWSETYKPGKADTGLPIEHAELSDIDGVVGIITKQNSPNNRQVQNPLRTTSPKPTPRKVERPTRRPKPKKTVDYPDDEEEAEQRRPELTNEEKIENEKKKALILDSVDELKERHENEQKLISEKVKEDAIYAEERDRDNIQREIFDKYNERPRNKNQDYDEYDSKYEEKYKISPLRKLRPPTTPDSTNTPNTKSNPSSVKPTSKTLQTGRMSVFRNPNIYMIYDEETSSTTDASTKSTETITLISTERSTESITLTSPDEDSINLFPDVTLPTSKLDKITTPLPKTSSRTRLTKKPLSKTLSSKEDVNGSERISLVPQDNELKEGEPTLFFPKRKRRKGGRKIKNQNNNSSDSLVSASSQNNKTQDVLSHLADAVWAGSETAPSGTATGNVTGPSGHGEVVVTGIGSVETVQDATGGSSSGETAVSASAEAESLPVLAVDAISASSDHKEEKGDHNHEHEHGGEAEHHAEHHSEHGESGKKAYEGFHEDKKTAKGHHDKEDHLGKYEDQGGSKKEHHDESKHYGGHHHEEHGKKHAKYEESGKHSKGHSTKGSHDIHKKEEYEKNVEFFEEEGDSAEEEKHGGHTEEHGHKKGGLYRKAAHDAGHHHRAKGDSGQFEKGGHHHSHRGHSGSAGHDLHGKHDASKFMEGGKKNGKKWIYHHGSPAKNANLVVIDRRGDQLYHGPQYYG